MEYTPILKVIDCYQLQKELINFPKTENRSPIDGEMFLLWALLRIDE